MVALSLSGHWNLLLDFHAFSNWPKKQQLLNHVSASRPVRKRHDQPVFTIQLDCQDLNFIFHAGDYTHRRKGWLFNMAHVLREVLEGLESPHAAAFDCIMDLRAPPD
jgi:hypothetical protein